MSYSRRSFLSTSGSYLGAALAAGYLPAVIFSRELKRRKKNILFIAVDDLRPELGCYNHSIVHSPHLDTLAKEGIVFDRMYCQQAVCGPTRASLLTGCRPDTTKVYDLVTHIRSTMPDVITLPQLFKNNGYHVEGLGKIFHNGLEDDASYSVPHRYAKGSIYATEENRRLRKSGGRVRKGSSVGQSVSVECADVPDDAYQDGKLAALAIESLQRLAPNAGTMEGETKKPFFLAVGFSKPHLPFCAPKKYWDLYDRASIPLPYPEKPKNAPEIAFTNWSELRKYSDIPEIGDLNEAKTRELIHGYYACVSFLDEQVGKVVDELKRLNLEKDTIIIVWGDHGWKLGEYSMWSKHTNFELDTRVPAILVDPDLPRGSHIHALTEYVDIYPTLADLCGLRVPEYLEGLSMVPLIENPTDHWKKAAFSQFPRPGKIMGYSIRTERYRYTEWQEVDSGNVKDRELYDLVEDPLCKESIALKEENVQLVAQLHDMLLAGWQKAKP